MGGGGEKSLCRDFPWDVVLGNAWICVYGWIGV